MTIATEPPLPVDLDGCLARVFGRATDPMPELERRALAELADQSVIVWEGDATTFQFTYVSASAERLLGYPRSRWTSEENFWSDVVIHPDDRDEALAYCALATGKNQDHAFIYRAITATGEIVHLHDIVRVVLGPRGVASRLRGVMIVVPVRDATAEA